MLTITEQYQSALEDRSGSVHTFSPSVIFQWIENGTIARFKVTDSTRETIDTYVNGSIYMLKNWTGGGKFYILHDIATKQFVMSPYVRARLDEVATVIKEGNTVCVSAVYMYPSYQATMIAFFGNSFSASAKNTTQQFFTNDDAAVRWLNKMRGK